MTKKEKSEVEELINDLMFARNEIDRLKNIIEVRGFNESLTLKDLNVYNIQTSIEHMGLINKKLSTENRMWINLWDGLLSKVIDEIDALVAFPVDEWGDVLPFAEYTDSDSSPTLKKDAQMLLDYIKERLGGGKND